jgi:hypothetical protein
MTRVCNYGAEIDRYMELTGENISKEWKKPLELFHEKEIVRICAPMVRYSKLVHINN